MSITDIVCELHEIETRIKAGESESAIHRWKFGRMLIALRGGKKQLPPGLREEITEKFGLEASEITRRMRLAELFATREEVVDACTRCGGSWRRIIREELAKRPRKEKGERTWSDRIRTTVHRVVEETNEDGRRADLVAILCEELRPLGLDVVDDEADEGVAA